MWIRTASEQDLETVSNLLRRVWHDTYDGFYGVDEVEAITREWHSVSQLAQNLKAPHSEFLIADDGERIAGMAFASQIDDKTVQLHQLYVDMQAQGRGAGSLLLEEVEECFFEVPKIILEVEEKNESAIRFYRKHGYEQSGTTQNCGKENSGYFALVFSKNRF